MEGMAEKDASRRNATKALYALVRAAQMGFGIVKRSICPEADRPRPCAAACTAWPCNSRRERCHPTSANYGPGYRAAIFREVAKGLEGPWMRIELSASLQV